MTRALLCLATMSAFAVATATTDRGESDENEKPREENTSTKQAPPLRVSPDTTPAFRRDGLIRPPQAPQARPQAKAPAREAPSRAEDSEQDRIAACKAPLRPTGTLNFASGETLVFDIDIMGVRAGSLTLTVDAPAGGGSPAFTASTRTNTFFANVREVEGRATSYTRDQSLRPIRYREDSTEDGVRKWSEVLFHEGRNEVDVRFGIGQRERRVRYPVADSPMDIISLIYYLRTLDLAVGDEICVDVYANRRVWRVTGEVASEEFVRTPAGAFEALLVSGRAKRMDRPSVERDLHIWLANDERRTPVAAMSVIDLGPVRARLARNDGSPDSPRQPSRGGGRW